MKLVTYEIRGPLGPIERFGVERPNGDIVDANAGYRFMLESLGLTGRPREVADANLPSTLLRFLQTGQVAQAALQETLSFLLKVPSEQLTRESVVWHPDQLRILSPLPKPNSFREFGQFERHHDAFARLIADQTTSDTPVTKESLSYWKGNPGAVIGPDATIYWPPYTTRLDFELELAAVVGRPGINLDPGVALDHIVGFTIFNDVSARDQQLIEMTKGVGPSKCKDFCNVLGPAIVTLDELDPDRFDVEVLVNGESWVKGDTRAMTSSWAEIVAYASKGEWIMPGDVLTSGTVDGCCAMEHLGWPETGALLHPGDVLELVVAGIGVLRNTVGDPQADVTPSPQQ